MKLSQKQVNELITMIEHSRQDISFREGGTFNCGIDYTDFDKKDAKRVENAINTIKRIILTN